MIPYIMEIVTYKERRIIMEQMYEFIKEFFMTVEPGLHEVFEWIEKIF